MRKEFGQYLRRLREEQRISARRFAQQLGMDASNYSKIERGEVPPPSESVLTRFAEELGISPATDYRWLELKDLADVNRGDVPSDLLERDDVATLLPALFAQLRREQVQSLEQMYEIYRNVAAGLDPSNPVTNR